MRLPLEVVRAALALPSSDSNAWVTGWSIDTRTLQAGDLFFALGGKHQDGHAFLAQAFDRGAVAAVVEKKVEAAGLLLPVASTLQALQSLAAFARRQWKGTVIGITGSAGKTTTKNVVAELLNTVIPTGRTMGNFNNHLGVPLSILSLPDEARAAAIEIGMNHAGEIRSLAAIARPAVAVITNAGYAHIENLGSLEAVALAKRELVEALPDDGVAVLNAGDPRVAAFARLHPGRTIRFGIGGEAEYCASQVEYLADGVRFRFRDITFESAMTGRHAVLNILAGLAVAELFGARAESLRDAVRQLRPAAMRGERIHHRGCTIWNDCYNANPDAVCAMLDALRDSPARRRIAVLGEMLELGRWADDLHREVGRHLASCGIDVLVGIRGAARHMVDAARQSGLADNAAFFFDEPSPAGEFLRHFTAPGDLILFKGSRGTQVERALDRYLAPE